MFLTLPLPKRARSVFTATLTAALAVLNCMAWPASAEAMGKKKMHCTIRIHAEANALDGNSFSSPITIPFPPNQIYIQKLPIFSEFNVNGFKSYKAADGSYGALLVLDPNGRNQLEAVSTQQPKTWLIVVVNGRLLDPVMIDGPVTDGKFFIKRGLVRADLEAFGQDFESIDGFVKGNKKKKKKREELEDFHRGNSVPGIPASSAPAAGTGSASGEGELYLSDSLPVEAVE